MFCPKCGQELLQGAKFCDKCGTPSNNDQAAPTSQLPNQNAPTDQTPDQAPANQFPDQAPGVRPPEIYADYPQTAPDQPRPKKKRVFLKIIAILLVAVIALSAVIVVGYYTFLPAKYTLLAAEYLTVQKAYNELDSSWTRLQKKTGAVYDNSVKTDTEISFSVDSNSLTGNGLDQQTTDLVNQYLTAMSLKIGTEADITNKKENFSLGLSYQNNPAVSFNGFIDGSKLGMSIPELSKKSIVGDLKDLPRLSELYPESIAPGRLDSFTSMDPWVSKTLHDQITIKHEDVKKLMQTYTMAFVNNLDAGDMSIKRGQTTDLFGEETKCQEVTVTLDQKAQKALFSSLLDTVKKDDNFYNLVFGNINKAYSIISESDPALKGLLQGVDLETALKRSNVNVAIDEIKRSLDEATLPQKMTLKVYIKGLDVVKYDIEIPVNDAGETVNLILENLINGGSVSDRLAIKGDIEGEALNACLDIRKQYDKASDTRDTTAEFNMDISGSTNGSFIFKFDNQQDPDGKNKVKQTTNITASGDVPDQGGKGEVTIASQGTISRNNDGLQTGYDGTVDVTVNVPQALQQPVKFGLGIKNTTEYGAKISTPDWATGDTVDLATASREDLDAYFQELNDGVSGLGMLLGGGY